MTPAQRRKLDSLASRIWMRQPSDSRSTTAHTIEEALRDGGIVSIDYSDESGNQTRSRLVEPMAFARTRQHWNVLAWCHLRQAGRWFRMDWITSANATNQPVAKRDLTEVFGDPPPEYALPVAALHGL